jgi:hypothetical protein
MAEPFVFISYRRSDSENATARVHNAFVRRFGTERIFLDTRSIEDGTPFPHRIKTAVGGCKVLVAVIGKNWLSVLLNRPTDWVRTELALALKAGIQVIPVFVDGATMPEADLLPDVLKPLTERNAVTLPADPVFDRELTVFVERIAALDLFCIFLGTDANDDDTMALHRRLSKELTKRADVRLLSGLPPPHKLDEHAAEARRLIASADLCVHLLGSGPGDLIDGSDKTYLIEQAAHSLAAVRAMLFLQSLKVNAEEVRDPAYVKFLADLCARNDARFELVFDHTDGLVKRVLAKKLEIERRRLETMGSLTAVVDVHPSDDGKAAKLFDYLERRQVTSRILSSGALTPRELDLRFADQLRQSQLFIVIYGAAGYEWVRGRVKQASNVALDEQLGTKVAVCLELPQKSPEQLRFSTPVINNLERFDSATMEQLLRQAGAA